MGTEAPTVVLVDNSPAIKKLFQRSIKDLGIELKIFDTAADSWNYLKDNQPDLLFLSIILPDKNGLSLLKDLRKHTLHQNTSVIMVSSKDYAQDKLDAVELGVVDFITKPMPIQMITDVVIKYTANTSN
ncbi:MAG: response regulator [Gammaproteobacteria bacterium]|nr:response regulator [Gammaproteobacteria bacterium]NIO61745.1 response regulator [Gammaproteobacteria bacterium]NIP48615.1 response regulator [Gammaproteobacteria bacterium]NIQ09067.1 response regulator [Gammaproteobacteria bacterium]NIQ18996.1 response regulator [Gammaproteobacteria bacterium]